MDYVDRSIITASRAEARRARSQYMGCLFIRFGIWLRERLTFAPPRESAVPCC